VAQKIMDHAQMKREGDAVVADDLLAPQLLQPRTEPALRRVLSLYLTGQFGKFLIAGGLAALANFASRFAFEPWFGFWGGVVAAYGVGFFTAFALNKAFVFPASGKPLREEMGWFFLFNALAFPIVLGASVVLNAYVFSRWLPERLSETIAHGIAIMLPVFVNFAAHKFITFRDR
jgi:putative flippase GtrA